MTDFDRPVTRRTVNAYRVSLSGAYLSDTGRRLAVTLHGGKDGDFLTIREAGRRTAVTLDVAELYRRGLMAQACVRRAPKPQGRKAQKE